MLNVFMLFANIFLRLLFFLAGLIPQLLQKSPEMAFLLIYPSNRNQASKPQIKQIRVFFMPFYASIVDKSPFSGKMIVL